MKKRLRFIRETTLTDIIGTRADGEPRTKERPRVRIWRVRNVQAGVNLGLIR